MCHAEIALQLKRLGSQEMVDRIKQTLAIDDQPATPDTKGRKRKTSG